jgi:threonine/homoserine/homoserine lactone efflux protein
MHEVFTALVFGTGLGLSAGLSPGPLTALVVSETLRHGLAGGIRVALAPLATDVPIILAALLALGALADADRLLAAVSGAGGAYLVYLACLGLGTDAAPTAAAPRAPGSFGKGVVVNALNPHPYVFWATVGAPWLLRPEAAGGARWAFIAGFYCTLIGSKVALALVAARFGRALGGRGYARVNRVLGLVLLAFGLLLIHDALSRLVPA